MRKIPAGMISTSHIKRNIELVKTTECMKLDSLNLNQEATGNEALLHLDDMCLRMVIHKEDIQP